jgi:hypothetical protein
MRVFVNAISFKLLTMNDMHRRKGGHEFGVGESGRKASSNEKDFGEAAFDYFA